MHLGYRGWQLGSRSWLGWPGAIGSKRKDVSRIQHDLLLKVGVEFWFRCRKYQETFILTLTMSISKIIKDI